MSESRQALRTMALRLTQGTHLPSHSFGWGQLVYADSGVARVTTQTRQWVLPSARALWVPPDIRHVLHCLTAIELRTLYFPPRHLPDLPEEETIIQVNPLLRALINRVTSLPWAAMNTPNTIRMIGVLRDELTTSSSEPLAVIMPTDRRALRVANNILEQEVPTAPLAELCQSCGASRRTLERLFRSQTGSSLGQWYQTARFHHALLLLGEGHPVMEVAESLGYRSTSAFVSAFRGRLGTTPGRYFTS